MIQHGSMQKYVCFQKAEIAAQAAAVWSNSEVSVPMLPIN